MKKPVLTSLLALAPLLPALAGCGSAGGAGGASPSSGGQNGGNGQAVAVATTTPLGSVVGDVVTCAGGTSSTLMSPGDDPHSFSPSPGQVRTLVESKLVVANGLGLEGGLSKTLDAAKQDGATVFEVAPLVDPIPFAEPGHAHEEPGHGEPGHEHSAGDEHDHASGGATEGTPAEEGHEGHHHGSQDPHFWLDASRMAKAASLVGDELAKRTGQDAYRSCGAQTRTKLEQVDAKVRTTLASIPKDRRVLITDHEAFGYFAKAYGFEVAGVVVPGGSTDAEPSSAELAALAKVVRDEKVPAIFSNTAASTALTDAVAKEAGRPIKVVPLFVGSLGPKDSGADTYAGMVMTNADRIASALKG